MKTATFNANSIRSRLPVLRKWLAEARPDVLCVQETKVQNADFPIEALEETGYNFVFSGEKKYNGTALLAKSEISDVGFGLDSEPADPSRIITATVEDVTFINTYIPQGRSPDSDMFTYKLEWFRRLGEYISRNFTPDTNLLWMGDLNCATDDRDVHDPQKLWGSVCYCQEVIDAMKGVMEWGFTDLFRKFHSEGQMYTFWDYRLPNGFKRNLGWRLDYIMASPAMAERCRSCYIDREPRGWQKPSDHTFLIAEFH